MSITAADRDQFEHLTARLVRAGQTPVALWGAGRTAEALRPSFRAAPGTFVGIIDDDARKHGLHVAGLPVLSLEQAAAAGARAVILTAEGAAQDAMWARRSIIRERGLYLLTCPARFESKPWDDALIDQFEHAMGAQAGLRNAYLHQYPAESPARPHLMIDRVLECTPRGGCVCEIGSGTGLCTQWVIEQAGEYHAVDFSRRLLFEAMEHRFGRHLGRLRLHHDETASLAGVPDAGIDTLFSYDVFVHFKIDLVHQFLLAARRVLKPSGRAVIHFFDWTPAAVEVWREHHAPAHRGGHSILFYNHPDHLRVSAGEAGLRMVGVTPMPPAGGYLAEFVRS